MNPRTRQTDRLRADLRQAAQTNDPGERTLRLAAVLTQALQEEGSRPVLVGGGAVEVYTRATYTTEDLDFVFPSGDATSMAMESLGFARVGRVWHEAELALVVEFPSSTLAPARATEIEVDGIAISIIEVEDLVADRLAAWKYWRWHPDGVAAGLLLEIHGDRLDVERLEDRCRTEEVLDALNSVRRLLQSAQQPALSVQAMEVAHRNLKASRRSLPPNID